MNRRQARHIVVAALVILTGLGAVPGNSNAAEQRAGIFQVSLPAAFTLVTGARLDEMRRTMNAGLRGLAQSSGLADPRDVSERGMSFFTVFRSANGRMTWVFTGNQLDQPTSIDEMTRTNAERVRWGIDSGQLKRSSRGVSRATIDGVPCLQQDIDHANGARLRTWLCFVPEAPRAHFSVNVICEDTPSCEQHRADVHGALRDMKIVRQTR